MFETIFESTSDAGLAISTSIISIVLALFLGFLISITYMLSDKERKHSAHFAITLVILPAVVAIVIMLVGSNVARAFSLAGAFALVRFRSVPGDSKDIASVFFSMAIGLASGMGYVSYAIIATAIIGTVYFVLMRSGFGGSHGGHKELSITIPEDMNYQGTFDDLFQKYTRDTKLTKVRTSNLGTLFKLTYQITLQKDADEKAFIDEIRCRNGNLNIVLCEPENGEKKL